MQQVHGILTPREVLPQTMRINITIYGRLYIYAIICLVAGLLLDTIFNCSSHTFAVGKYIDAHTHSRTHTRLGSLWRLYICMFMVHLLYTTFLYAIRRCDDLGSKTIFAQRRCHRCVIWTEQTDLHGLRC